MNKKPQLNFLCWFRRGRSEVSCSKSLDLMRLEYLTEYLTKWPIFKLANEHNMDIARLHILKSTIDTWSIVILPDKALLLCSDDVLPCVVTPFIPADVLGGLVLAGTGWTKQIPWQAAVKET